MTDSELQGQLSALSCFVAALSSTLPLSVQFRLWPAFEAHAGVIRGRLGRDALRGFEQAAVLLSSGRGG